VSPQGVFALDSLPVPAGAGFGSIQFKGDQQERSLISPVPAVLRYDIRGKGYTRFRAVVGADERSQIYHIAAKVRFFVFTEAPDRSRLVRVEGKPPVPPPVQMSRTMLVDRLYRHALSRDPAAAERSVANEFLKEPGAEGIEDLLWAVLVSPEFQLIR